MKTEILYALYHPQSEAERLSSQLLTESNLQNIKNLMAMEVQNRLNQVPPTDESGYLSFVQFEADVRGAIRAYQNLINLHEEVIERTNKESLPSVNSQS